jgi:antibiotic biosynthesis monooxygenase (ABM) superfamily enzyme
VNKEPTGQPPRWKRAVVVWLGLCPLLQVLNAMLFPWLTRLPAPLRLVMVSVVLVLLMTYVVGPVVNRLLRSWLYRTGP